MEFRLVYRGALPSDNGSGSRAHYKHIVRRYLHPQLRALWQSHPDLKTFLSRKFYIYTTPSTMVSAPGPNQRIIEEDLPSMSHPGAKTWIDTIADQHVTCNSNRFVPLIREANGYTCALDILFLRRQPGTSLINNGGDIDNRIKTLFDGLRMPKQVNELGHFVIDPVDEDPFYCLLEDDCLISKISVTTDLLLRPLAEGEHIDDVELVIHVTVVDPSSIFSGNRLP